MKLDSGIGFCIPAGSVVGLELHSVPNGEATTDQTSVGFVFAKENMFGFLFFTRDDEALNLAVDPETGHVIEN